MKTYASMQFQVPRVKRAISWRVASFWLPFSETANYLGMEYATNEKIVHYLQFMDKLNGIHSDKPMYPTVLFHERIEERNDVILGAYNFYYLTKTDMDNLLENAIYL